MQCVVPIDIDAVANCDALVFTRRVLRSPIVVGQCLRYVVAFGGAQDGQQVGDVIINLVSTGNRHGVLPELVWVFVEFEAANKLSSLLCNLIYRIGSEMLVVFRILRCPYVLNAIKICNALMRKYII